MMKRKILGVAAFALVTLGGAGVSHANLGWTPWVSEENGGPWTYCVGSNEAARGFFCSGGYCDNVRLYCDVLPFDITVHSYVTSGFFSEETDGVGTVTSQGWYRYDTDNSHVCNYSGAAGVMTGIRCRGGNCDDINIECATPYTYFDGAYEPVELTDCEWTGYVSEENSPMYMPVGYFISGVQCQGSKCDNKRFYMCRMQPSADSCEESCGGEARSGCGCDPWCDYYGDCCSDYVDAC